MHPNRQLSASTTFTTAAQRLQDTGSVKSQRESDGDRRRNSSTDDEILNIEEDGSTVSTRHIAHALNLLRPIV